MPDRLQTDKIAVLYSGRFRELKVNSFARVREGDYRDYPAGHVQRRDILH
jgi:hypothetical protein